MTTSSTTCASWCTDHRGDLCASATWTVADIRMFVYGCDDDMPPVSASVRMPTRAAGYSLAELTRLGDAISALAMLGHGVDPSSTDYWTGRLDALQDHDRATTS